MERRLLEEIGHRLRAQVHAATPVRGGDVAASYRLELAGGGRVFAKTHHDPPPGFFTTEAAGLRWLRDAGAVRVPEVLAVSDDPAYLVLEWIEEGRRGPTNEQELGRDLAALHRAGAPSFGREDRRTTGSRGLPNDPCDTWHEFLAQRRLLPWQPWPARPGSSTRQRSAASSGSPPAASSSSDRPSRRRDSTATCGAATGSWTGRVAAG